jgi:hypothetical protein
MNPVRRSKWPLVTRMLGLPRVADLAADGYRQVMSGIAGGLAATRLADSASAQAAANYDNQGYGCESRITAALFKPALLVWGSADQYLGEVTP